jgi:hypothetical protein
MEEAESKRTTLEREGPPLVVDTIVTLLRYIEACGVLGTTRWVELMVDGDGGGQLALRIDGEARPLNEAEQGFLLEGEGEGTPELRSQCVTTEQRADGTLLRVELV